MTDIPIIFSGPMILALLQRRKSMTRRLAWRDAAFGLQDYESEQLEEMEIKGWNVVGEGNEGQFRVYKPTAWQRVKPGDRLWVRENLTRSGAYIQYAVDHKTVPGGDGSVDRFWPSHWKQDPRPSIHMPRERSRLTLIVTAKKIERLDVISEADAVAEGAVFHDGHGVGHSGWRHDPTHGFVHRNARTSFACLWDRLHGDGSFNMCQEVVALSFTVQKSNIDALPKVEAA